MLEFLVDAEYFQIIISDKKHHSSDLSWDTESLSQGITYNNHDAFIATYGDDCSYSASIMITLIDESENLSEDQQQDYEFKARISFEGKLKQLFIYGKYFNVGGKSITVDRDNYSIDVYTDKNIYPQQVILKFVSGKILSCND